MAQSPNPKTEDPSLDVERVPIEALTEDPRNVRVHPERNLAAIKDSLARFGQQKPIVVDREGVVVAGNGTLVAARALGWTHLDVVRTELDGDEARAFAIADNRTAELAEWDYKGLMDALGTLPEEARRSTGFSAEEIAELFQPPVKDVDAEPKIEIADQLRVKWGTEPGQLWSLGGRHRLLCGDSTNAEDVARVMGDGPMATVVFTDPPYGVAIGQKNAMLNEVTGKGGSRKKLQSDSEPSLDLGKLLSESLTLVRSAIAGDECAIFITFPLSGKQFSLIMGALAAAKLEHRHVLVWAKNRATFSLGRLDYDYEHEPILFTWTKTHKRRMNGEHKTSVWKIDSPMRSAEHPTMKPVALVVNAILNHSDPGDVVADVFCGSGTTIIAAEQTGRLCRAIEIAPEFVAVCLERFAEATGVTPELVAP